MPARLLFDILFFDMLFWREKGTAGSKISGLGLDVSQPVATEDWKCLKAAGYEFAAVRIYQSNDAVDPNGATTIKRANDAGFYTVGYIFPNKTTDNPRSQVRSALSYLQEDGAVIFGVYIIVQAPQYWSTTPVKWENVTLGQTYNVQFIRDMVDELQRQNMYVGIFTNQYQWNTITGYSDEFKNLRLWYIGPLINDKPSFNGFTPFGGWEKPSIKQYSQEHRQCNVATQLLYFNWDVSDV